MSDDPADPLDDLAEAFLQRLRAGEEVGPEAYARAHPGLAERILELFPVLALMEGLKPPAPQAPARAEPAPSEDATRPARRPRRIGPYKIVRELGRGGMGRVYAVLDPQGVRRALKVVHPHLLERSGFLARFLREIEAGRRVEHPGVVRTLESGVAEVEGVEVPYVLLEYVEGETLRDLLDETGGISERLAREIGIAMAEALAAIHDAGLVHRDVKPENVIIAPDESIKLMDLGVVLVQEEALRLTQTGEFVGSLLYAAPEQLRQGHVDGRADLFALGLVLYELLAGTHPEVVGPGPALPQKFAQRRVRPLRESVPHATPFFERVVQALLAPHPAQRLDDAAEVARILREGEQGAWWREARLRQQPRTRPQRFVGSVGFVGREREQAWLDVAWATSRAGAGQVRILRGEAGIGKSRLLSRWLDRVEAQDAAVVVWVEHAPGADVPGLSPIARSLRDVLGDEPDERLRAWLGDRADRADEVLASLDHAGRPEHVGALGSAELETMILQLLRALAREQPLVLVIEDLHFATDEGRALFDRLACAFAEDPILLVGTTRPVDAGAAATPLDQLPQVAVFDVEALDEAAALELLYEGLGQGPQPADAARALVRISDGNPYCLLEFAHDLRVRATTGSQPVGGDVVLPRSVRRLVEARLHALSPEDRDLLSVAACCGHRFDPVVVCEAAELPRIAGLRTLHRLERERGLIVADGAAYRFHHHVVQEALHDELPPALRADYHTALGAACEARLDADPPPAGAAAFAVARHFLLGREPARSAPYLISGLDYLFSMAEGGRAARMARRALEALPDAEPALHARLLFYRGRAMDGNAPPPEIVAVLEEALAACRATDDRALELDCLQHLGAAVSHTGRHAEAAGISAQAVELAERVGDPVRLARALTSHATSSYNQGDQEAAFAHGRRALELAREAGAATQAGQTASVLSAVYLEAGRLDDARPLAEMALSATHVHGDRAAERFVSAVLAKMVHLQGDARGALTLIERSRALARETGNLRVAISADIGLAQVLLNLGRASEALACADQAAAVCERMAYLEVTVLLSTPRALAASALGDLKAAWAAAARGRELLERVPLPAIAARTLPTVANALAWMGAFEETEAAIESGLAAAEQARVPRERTQIEQAAAGLLDARGRTAEAAEGYAEVLAAMRAAGWDLHVALVACRLGGLHVRLRDEAAARRHLEEALDIAEKGPLPAVSAEAGIWLDLLPGGNLQRARIALERDVHLLASRARLRLGLELARRTDAEEDHQRARDLAEALIAAAPAAYRERMRRDVALYRDALA